MSIHASALLRLDAYAWDYITAQLDPNSLSKLILCGNRQLGLILSQTTHFNGKSTKVRYPDLEVVLAMVHRYFPHTRHFNYSSLWEEQRLLAFDWRDRLPTLLTLRLSFNGSFHGIFSVGPLKSYWPLLEELDLVDCAQAGASWEKVPVFVDLSALPPALRVLRLQTRGTITKIVPTQLMSLPCTLEVLALQMEHMFVYESGAPIHDISIDDGWDTDDWSDEEEDEEIAKNSTNESVGTQFGGAFESTDTYIVQQLPSGLKSLTLSSLGSRKSFWSVSVKNLPSSLTYFSGSKFSVRGQQNSEYGNKIDWLDVYSEHCHLAVIDLHSSSVRPIDMVTLPLSVTTFVCELEISHNRHEFQQLVNAHPRLLQLITQLPAAAWHISELTSLRLHSFSNLRSLTIEHIDMGHNGPRLPDCIEHLSCGHIPLDLLPAGLLSLFASRIFLPVASNVEEAKKPNNPLYHFPRKLRHLKMWTNALSAHPVLISGLPPSLETLDAGPLDGCLPAFSSIHLPLLSKMSFELCKDPLQSLQHLPQAMRTLKLSCSAATLNASDLSFFRAHPLTDLELFFNFTCSQTATHILDHLPHNLRSLTICHPPAIPHSIAWPVNLVHFKLFSTIVFCASLPSTLGTLHSSVTVTSPLPPYLSVLAFNSSIPSDAVKAKEYWRTLLIGKEGEHKIPPFFADGGSS